MNCAACQQGIGRGEILPCVTCKGVFHYRCLNMTTAFYTENKPSLLSFWRCPNCETITRRPRNDSTPTRKQHQQQLNDTTMSVDDFALHDKSVLGDTVVSYETKESLLHTANTDTDTITFDRFSQLLEITLDKKLEKHKQQILTDIRTAIQLEITKTTNNLKKELTQHTEEIRTEQIHVKKDISTLQKTIETLQAEHKKLQNEIQALQVPQTQLPMTQLERCETKTFVVYGLNEYHNEHEIDLEQRIIHAFMEVMNINLAGYIEEIQRIGRRGNRRPVRIELISKRMTKYILHNVRQFKSSGLYISEFLDQKALQDKRNMLEKKRSLIPTSNHIDRTRALSPRSYDSNKNAIETATQPLSSSQSTKLNSTQPTTSTQGRRSNNPAIGGTFRF